VWQFFKALGIKPRKVGQIPSKADVTAQEAFKTGRLEPRLEEAKAGQRLVFFTQNRHLVTLTQGIRLLYGLWPA
jgi:hypothetical protein